MSVVCQLPHMYVRVSVLPTGVASMEQEQESASFLRVQYCKVNDTLSAPMNINVQGSGLSTSLYVIMECDFKPLSQQNILIKYADNTNLVVPEHSDGQLDEEFCHIEKWAFKNKMIINKAQTKELVFRRSSTKFDLPSHLMALLTSVLLSFSA